jgi:hypothetical protein
MRRNFSRTASGHEPSRSYCLRLAQELARSPKRKNMPEVRRKQLRDICHGLTADFFVGTPTEQLIEELAAALASHSHHQAYLAAFTTYTPSKWLLEQELSQRQSNNSFEAQSAASLSPEASQPSWESSWTGSSDIYVAAAEQSLVGLCFSGGGIRSATFNLGVLQGLAARGLLNHIDYLSSVSGGGYIHEWFAAWVLRSPEGLEEVQKKLKPQPVDGSPARAPEPIFWLRRYASYLTPQRGVFSADTWTMIAIWFRNTLLNQIVLFSFMALVLFLFRLLLAHQGGVAIGAAGETKPNVSFHTQAAYLPLLQWSLAVISAINALFLAFQIGFNFYREGWLSRRNELLDNGAVVWRIVMPGLFLSLATTFLLASGVSAAKVAVAAGVFFAVTNLVTSYSSLDPARNAGNIRSSETLLILAGAFGTASFVAALLYLAEKIIFWPELLKKIVAQDSVYPLQLVIAPAILYSAPFLAANLQLGILGGKYLDSRREWIARLRAWTVLVSFAWIVLSGVSLVGPGLVSLLIISKVSSTMKWSAVVSFVGSHFAALYSGASGKSDGSPSDKGIFGYTITDWIGFIAAPVAILTLLVAISFVLGLFVNKTQEMMGHASSWYLDAQNVWPLVLLLLLLALFGFRVDANEFSMHGFYRNRLARCYLGASLEDRRPNPFTGFDERSELLIGEKRSAHDQGLANINVWDLLPQRFQHEVPHGRELKALYTGPFPIFSCTLNLTFGQDLAYQERKGASFAFTPLYSGYHVGWTGAEHSDPRQSFNGFVPTRDYAYRGGGVSLSTATAISGAAMSPNQGFSTKATLAFLMTLFNVRLGWWIANTRRPSAWPESRRRSAPTFPLWNLLKELFGAADDSNDFIYLNDGGKFDNMGLYELVRRRCRFIIISDAEQDGDLSFDGIAMAIRKCRTDFGAEITLDLKPIRNKDEKTKRSKAHFVMGTIRYPAPPLHREEDGFDIYKGVVVYLKSSLTGDEPADVLSYALEHSAFPHDMTTNQWFTESQFESYRRLGQHILTDIFPDGTRVPKGRGEVQQLFHSIGSARRSAQLDEVDTTMRKSSSL